MGVSISGFDQAIQVEAKYFTEDGEPLQPNGDPYPTSTWVVKAYIPSPDFGPSLDGLVEGAWYALPRPAVERWSFSYGTYNLLREDLCIAALGIPPMQVWESPEDFAGQPLIDLINFSDCEGTIGPLACSRILEALDRPGIRERFMQMANHRFTFDHNGQQTDETYETFRTIFRAGSTGMVMFS